jgi:hypothetical protein
MPAWPWSPAPRLPQPVGLDQLCLTAGEGAGNIDSLLPAGRIVEEMTQEASAILEALAKRQIVFQGMRALTAMAEEVP